MLSLEGNMARIVPKYCVQVKLRLTIIVCVKMRDYLNHNF